MKHYPRSEPAILKMKLVRGLDGRLQIEQPNGSLSSTQKPKTKLWHNGLSLSKLDIRWLQAEARTFYRFISAPLAMRTKRARTLIWQKAKHIPRLTYAVVSICGLVLIVGATLWHAHQIPTQIKSTLGSVQGAQTAAGPTPGKPSYTTLLPTGKNIANLGGWYRVSPPNSDPAYAFADRIGAVQLDVSEQPLPESFHDNTADQVAQLAQGFGANEKLTANNLTVYIGTSAKGPQSVIFTKSNLLILIKSTDKLTSDQWLAYITSLQ